jgi:hypothetical protein
MQICSWKLDGYICNVFVSLEQKVAEIKKNYADDELVDPYCTATRRLTRHRTILEAWFIINLFWLTV